MRPLIAAITAILIMGSVRMFIQRNLVHSAPEIVSAIDAEGSFSVEVLTTFETAPDPFAINEEDATSLSVEFRGHRIIDVSKAIPAGTLTVQHDVQGVSRGKNEFYVIAVPDSKSLDQVHAVRVRILRDGQPVGESWVASEPGMPVSDRVSLEIGPTVSISPENAPEESHST